MLHILKIPTGVLAVILKITLFVCILPVLRRSATLTAKHCCKTLTVFKVIPEYIPTVLLNHDLHI